jgi:outer membrane protein TolC
VAGVLFVFNLNTLNAQEVDSTATNSLSLRPLSELIEAAIQNAPELRNNQVDYARQALAYKIQKRNWVDNLSINGTSLYGNGSVVDYSNAGSSSTYVLSDRKSLNFNIGVGIRITGGDIVNRGAKAEMQRLQLDHIQNERQIIENRIREVVINVYSQLELALKVVKLRSEVVENQRLVLSIAEKYFKEGNYKPADYSSMLDKITAAQEQFEQAKADAKKLALLLKNITNVSVWE